MTGVECCDDFVVRVVRRYSMGRAFHSNIPGAELY